MNSMKRSATSARTARVAALLAEIGGCEFDDAETLIRFHEALLFIRAYPQDAAARFG
jgi:hypothetical protein